MMYVLAVELLLLPSREQLPRPPSKHTGTHILHEKLGALLLCIFR